MDSSGVTVASSPSPSRFGTPSPRTIESTGVHGRRLPVGRHILVYDRLPATGPVHAAAAPVRMQHTTDVVGDRR